MAAGLILAIIVFGLVALWSLWKGMLPFVDHPWWLARAIHADANLRSETILRWMVNLRFHQDDEPEGWRPPERWMISELRQTPEALILETVELFEQLKDGGLSDAVIREKLQSCSKAPLPSGDWNIQSYLSSRLELEAPQYMALRSQPLDQAIEIATTYARAQIKRSKGEPPRGRGPNVLLRG